MRAAIMRGGRLEVDELDDPVPGPGQVLVRTLACGICGSDLHALHHAPEMVAMSEASSPPPGMPAPVLMDPSRDVVMGHEFCAEVVALGENVGHREGDVVVSVPVVLDPAGVHPVGYSNAYPGGYAELMVLSDFLCLGVPNGLDPHLAALTEPLAVGVHAVAKSRAEKGTSAVVIGCGPVGLAVIAWLMRWLTTKTFLPFVIYRLALGLPPLASRRRRLRVGVVVGGQHAALLPGSRPSGPHRGALRS